MHTRLHLEDPWIDNDKSASGPSPILDFGPPYKYYNQTQMAPSHGIVYCRAQSKFSKWYNWQSSISWLLLFTQTGSSYIRLFHHFDGELCRTTVRKICYQKCSQWTTCTHFACMAWAYIWSLLHHLWWQMQTVDVDHQKHAELVRTNRPWVPWMFLSPILLIWWHVACYPAHSALVWVNQSSAARKTRA